MLRIAVCDDEETVCGLLEKYILDSCNYIGINVEIDIFLSGSILKKELQSGNVYNIFFLDIELQDDTGINISDFIRNELKNESSQIIYVSGKNEYDRQLFAFRPFSFIEKPFDNEVIRNTLEKYVRIYGNNNELFCYKYGHDTYWVNINNILYFKSNRRKVDIYMLEAKDEFYGTIQGLTDKLVYQGFISPHKSYLINFRFIKSFQGQTIIMTNNDKIPIAKGKRDEISKLLLRFENGGH